MKPSKTRLKDVLDDKMDKSKWDIIFGKLKKLGTAIEMYWGDHMNIDGLTIGLNIMKREIDY